MKSELRFHLHRDWTIYGDFIATIPGKPTMRWNRYFDSFWNLARFDKSDGY